MATVQKLRVKGIRSFAPDNEAVITFYKPLTLIVGENGAGKTTVIESLKYATTGEFPPPTKTNGQAFIHDPKVAGEREVKAQIKLQFRNVSGKEVVCTRNLQLTQKAQKLEAKTVDSTIQTTNDAGEKVNMSKRCADLDRLIPEMMGVSPAVLDNVIFCHQEEANWPLGDSTSLKKKFDDIFAASRYRKALDVINKQRKEHNEKVRILRAELETAKEVRAQALKIRTDLNKQISESNQSKVREQELDVDIASNQKMLDQTMVEYHKIRDFHNQREQSKAMELVFEKTCQRLREQLGEEYEEDYDALMKMKREFDGQVEHHKQSLESNLRTQSALSSEVNTLQQQLTNLSRDLGTYGEQANQQEKRIRERDVRMMEVAQKYQIHGYSSGPFTTSQAAHLMTELEDRWRTKLADTESTKQAFQQKERNLTAKIDELKTLQTQHNEMVRIKEEQQRNNNERLRQLQSQMTSVVMGRSLDDVERELRREETALAQHQSGHSAADLEREVRDLQRQKEEADRRLAELNEKQRSLNMQSTARARLEEKKRQHTQKSTEFNEQWGTKVGQSERLLNRHSLNVDDTHDLLVAEQRRRATDVAEKQDFANNARRDVSAFDMAIKDLEKQLQGLELELRESRERIQVSYDGTIPDGIATAELRLAEFKEQKNEQKNKFLIHALGTYLRESREKHECGLCRRPFTDEASRRDFERKMQERLDKVNAGTTPDVDNQIADLTQILQRLQLLRPVHDRCEVLAQREIPDVRARIQEKSDLQKRARQELTTAEIALTAAKSSATEILELVPWAERCRALNREVTTLRRDIDADESRLGGASGATSVDDVVKMIDSTNQQISSLGRKMDEQRQLLFSRNTEQHRREKSVLTLKEELARTRSAHEQRETNIRVQSELTAANARLIGELQDLNTRGQPSAAELGKLIDDREGVRMAQAQHVTDITTDAKKVEQDISWLKSTSRDIDEYINQNRAAELVRSDNKQKDLQTKLDSKIKEKSNVDREVEESRTYLLEQEKQLRAINDNVKLREQAADLTKAQANTASIDAEIQKTQGLANVEHAIKYLRGDLDEAERAKAQIGGQRLVYERAVRELKSELRNDRYKSAEQDYKKKVIELKTTEIAATDLAKYHSALDRALLRYHSLKMTEINKIIKELWQKTYRGADIDTLEIRSDDTQGKANYNYRVVMLKQNTELSMRGRCSAGQKVLGSLIIRLALAETFCLNCGILALDEPTTNLDQENMESFAEGLRQLIDDRSKQSNFQLIIITHDIDFVRLLGEKAEYYWRVSKDSAGHSEVKRMASSELNGR